MGNFGEDEGGYVVSGERERGCGDVVVPDVGHYPRGRSARNVVSQEASDNVGTRLRVILR